MLDRLVFTFHYLHYFAEQLLVLVVDLEFLLAVVGRAHEPDVSVALRTCLIHCFLHVGDCIDHVLVVLCLDQYPGHISIVVDGVILIW